MRVYMLHEARLGPIPKDIVELQCWDEDMLIYPAGSPQERVSGRSVYLEGSPEAFVRWLKPFNGVWIGKGQPFEEQFEVMHVG